MTTRCSISSRSHLQAESGNAEGDFITPIGKCEIVKEGSDITIVTLGRMLQESLKAVDQLAKDGIKPELIDLLTVSPLTWTPSMHQ